MSKLKLIGLLSAWMLILSANVQAKEGLSSNLLDNTPTHTLTHTLELKPISYLEKGYQMAETKFLPELESSELGFGAYSTEISHNQGNNCSAYGLNICPTKGICSVCPFNHRLKKLNNCSGGWTKSGETCSPSSCELISTNYKTSIPNNNICDNVFEYNLSCYKNCRPISCSGYTINCETFNVANSADKETCSDCTSANAKCSPELCKIKSCLNGYKLANSGTSCIPLDDTCPTGYYKSCSAGTQGTPLYTEAGSTCYQCKPACTPIPNDSWCQYTTTTVSDGCGGTRIGCSQTQAKILYSDRSISENVIKNKIPIGIVYDEGNHLAVALQYLDDNWQGAINNAKKYFTTGTSAGEWYLGSLDDYKKINNISDGINKALSLLSRSGQDVLVMVGRGWTSTQTDGSEAYVFYVGRPETITSERKTTTIGYRPMIKYQDVTPVCISEADVQIELGKGKYIFRTPANKNNFCGNPTKWEKILCEDTTTKIFECSSAPSGPSIEYDSNGHLTTNGAIGWIKSRYCAGAFTKAQCLSNYNSVILNRIATTNLASDIYGENFTKYINSYSFNKNICDWCLDL